MSDDKCCRGFITLPGGWENHLENLRKILSKIRKDKPTLNELSRWASAEFKTKEEWTKNALRSNVIHMSLATEEGGRLYLTEEGKKFLDTGDKEILLNLFCKNFWGVREMLLWLRERSMTIDELLEKFRSIGASWKKGYQVEYRLQLLRALGVVAVDRSGPKHKYSLTNYGIKFVKSLEAPPEARKEPSHNEVVSVLAELGEILGFYVKKEESISEGKYRYDVTWRTHETRPRPDKVFEVALRGESVRNALLRLKHADEHWGPNRLYLIVADEEEVKETRKFVESTLASIAHKLKIVSWPDINAVYECLKTKKDLVKELNWRPPP